MIEDATITLSLAVLGAIAGLAALGWLVHLERRGSSHVAPLILVALVLADTLLYPVYGTTAGVMEINIAGGSIGAPAAFALAALTAKLLVPRPSRPLALTAGLWAAFMVWLLGAAIRGLLAGHDAPTVFNQTLVILHVGVVALLVADSSVERLTGSTGITRLAAVFAPVVALVAALQLSGQTFTGTVPLLGEATFGQVGADAATALVTLGALTFATGLSRPRARWAPLVSGAILLCAPFVMSQRAAWIGALVTMLALGWGTVASRRRGMHWIGLRGDEAVGGVLFIGAVAACVLLWGSLTGRMTALLAYFTDPFTSIGNQQSAQSRLNQWDSAFGLVSDQPFIGSGLGVTYRYFEEGSRTMVESNISHNILLDVALRGGVVAVLLLLLAVASTLVTAGRTVVTRAPWPAIAVALGAGAAFAGLVSKGMVESVLEKDRLAVMLGLCVGLIHAAWSAGRAAGTDHPTRSTDQPVRGGHAAEASRSTSSWT